jgi:hypothetical protein
MSCVGVLIQGDLAFAFSRTRHRPCSSKPAQWVLMTSCRLTWHLIAQRAATMLMPVAAMVDAYGI